MDSSDGHSFHCRHQHCFLFGTSLKWNLHEFGKLILFLTFKGRGHDACDCGYCQLEYSQSLFEAMWKVSYTLYVPFWIEGNDRHCPQNCCRKLSDPIRLVWKE